MLDWKPEYCPDGTAPADWHHAGTNLALDFHGDPGAELVIFSDGNHHMALLDAVCEFGKRPDAPGVFYTTTPPGPLAAALRADGLRLGNLLLRVRPHVFISPRFVLEPLQRDGLLGESQRLFTSTGTVLLIPRGNPKGIHSVADLVCDDLRLFLSNPDTEKASYNGYRAALDVAAAREGVDLVGLREHDDARIVYGTRIHHREAPEAVAAGQADCAVVYHHLGLRYTRIFPDQFEMVPLPALPDIEPASSHIALVGDGGRWGKAFMEFMLGESVAKRYREHGMEAG